jgi:transposase
VGLDVGLNVFYANSDGETVEIPQYYRKAEKRLNRLNRKKSRFFRTYTVENSASSLSVQQCSKVDKYQFNKNSKP